MEIQESAPPGGATELQKPLIVCRQIGKRFPNGTLALSGLDLNVGAHEFLSLLGPSGCGKSTVLRLMARLAAPTEGSIEWRGARGEPDPLAISFVFQEPTLMPWATAVANVALPLDLAGIPKREARERARAALSLVGLSGFEGAYPSELSGGMRMRVSIARAIVTEPALLLLDEPFAALDEITRFKLNNDLLELWQRTGFTVIFVTHSVFESVFLSQRIAVMAARPGRIIQEISIAEPYPRGAGFRVSPAYLGYCRQTSEWLELAMSNEGAPAASNR